ncbi:glycerophosphodiester phosphodiesterase [Alteromonas flava]|uniref:glycerophosphodiester phosphodiesterase n=1 Tax=Alteromonas flava TaxID=2048003 RepID=UPI000C2938F4|nr:glycerophosphodiester phosphodiesterase [Alteromonas flava]
MSALRHCTVVILAVLLAVGCTTPHRTDDSNEAAALIIAHRGASGYLPEHTLSAALLAYQQGADYIEQDLVMSRDGHLVVLHDIHIDRVTNVAEVFPTRKRQDGRYYAIDFDLAELKELAVIERRKVDGSKVYPARYGGDATFKIATFEEHIQLIQQLNKIFNQQVGIYAEIKAPAWHRLQGKDITLATVVALDRWQLNNPTANVFLQCFDFAEIQRLRDELKVKVPLIQLIGDDSWQESDTDYAYLLSTAGLAEVARYADGIGPWLPQVLAEPDNSGLTLAQRARQQQLLVHAYTFRSDDLPSQWASHTLLDALFNEHAIDGVFTDQTDVVRAYLDHISATVQR